MHFTSIKPIDKYKMPGIYNLFLTNNFLPVLDQWEYTLIYPDGKMEKRIQYKSLVRDFPIRFPKVKWDQALPHCNEYGGIYFKPETGAFKAIVPNDFRY